MRRLVVTSLTVATLGVAGTTMAVAASVGGSAHVSTGAAITRTVDTANHVTAPLAAAVAVQPVSGANGQTCPPPPPNGGGTQPCGVDHHGGGGGGSCPPNSQNGGGSPPCGKDHHSPSPSPSSSGGSSSGGPGGACGPKDQAGSTPATGPVSGIVYQAGAGLGGPVGDALQQIACAIFTNLKL